MTWGSVKWKKHDPTLGPGCLAEAHTVAQRALEAESARLEAVIRGERTVTSLWAALLG
jgi:hypothetical protein